MPPPKDPEKYAEYIRKQSESHKWQKISDENLENLRKINKNNKYGLGKKHTDTWKAERSAAMMGHKGYSIGRKPTEMEIKKMRERSAGERNPNYKGKSCTKEWRRKKSERMSGEKHPNYGKHLSETTRKKISVKHIDKILSTDHCKKLSESHMGKYCGKNSPNWKGGTSFIPYCFRFNETQKRSGS
jgi:hypothetical protein